MLCGLGREGEPFESPGAGLGLEQKGTKSRSYLGCGVCRGLSPCIFGDLRALGLSSVHLETLVPFSLLPVQVQDKAVPRVTWARFSL